MPSWEEEIDLLDPAKIIILGFYLPPYWFVSSVISVVFEIVRLSSVYAAIQAYYL
jgi:hypothetical protein